MKAERTSEALTAFARNAGSNGSVAPALGRAPSGNVVLHVLPPCTPELQPAEPLWPLVRAAVASRSLVRIDRLRNIVRDRVNYLAEHPDEVQPRRLPLGRVQFVNRLRFRIDRRERVGAGGFRLAITAD